MKLSRSVSYAVGILLQIENHRRQGPVTAAQVAKGCKFPPRFLYRVLRRLVDAGILTGVSGPGGGYQLARPARQINLAQIVAAVEGPRERSALEAVRPKYRKAMKHMNELVDRGGATFERSLARVSLAKLSKL